MAAPLNPQEIYLQERYISVDYFGQMRDAWASLVAHAERCLDVFMRDLPPHYRSRSGEYQPDIVWGERVLVNFRDTLSVLNAAFIRLTHGDHSALVAANGVQNDFSGFSRDYSAEWMDEPSVAKLIPKACETFYEFMGQATMQASNIVSTHGVEWRVGALGHRYASSRGPLNPPAQWPTYRLNPKVRATSGQTCPHTGIYLPDINDAPAAFFIEGEEVWNANVGLDPRSMQRDHDEACAWTLVERVSNTGGGIPSSTDAVNAGIRLRCLAGETCPRKGHWSTPAGGGHRRMFQQGELMPALGDDYGVTIWQLESSD